MDGRTRSVKLMQISSKNNQTGDLNCVKNCKNRDMFRHQFPNDLESVFFTVLGAEVGQKGGLKIDKKRS
jgi:hypothetical protein